MEQAPDCHRYLSNAFYRAMCTSNPGSKTDILYHPSTVAGQTLPLPPLRAKKTSFRRVLTQGAGDYFLISLLNGRDGTEQFSFTDAGIKEARDAIGHVIVEHSTVGHYTKVEEIRADEDRPLKQFEAHRAVACGIQLTPGQTLHSFAEDVEKQTMSLRHYLDIDSLGPATDALRLGLVVVWLQSPFDPDEYVVYFNHAKGCLHQIFRGQNEEGPVVNILYHNAANPEDPDVYNWANTLVAHTELLVPVDAGDGTTTTLDERDIAYHTERVTTEFKKIIEEGLESKISLPRDGEGISSRIETPFSKLPEVLEFKKEVSDVLKSWVSDATPDYSAIRSARVPDDGARGGSGSQDRPKPFINRVELLAMFAKTESRDGEGISSRIETPFSKLPEVLEFKKEVSDVLKSWVSDATPDYSAIRSARVPDDGARGGSGSQDRPKPFINRVELLAMFAKQKKDFCDALEIPTHSLDSGTSTEGQGPGNPSSKDSSK